LACSSTLRTGDEGVAAGHRSSARTPRGRARAGVLVIGAARQLRHVIVATALCTLAISGATAAPNPIGEAQATAGFLFNCVLFVEWPGPVPPHGDIRLGLAGADPVVDLIDDMQGRKINGRVLRVTRLQPGDDVRAFDMLFISDDPANDTAAILARLADAPILTIGEERDFTAEGGVVRLYTEQEKLRFEIHMAHADRAHLKFSAKMLALARIVR
jgi:hypothetical protein